MEYKNAYESLIEAVRTLLKNNPSDEGIQNWAKENVPQIFESEDERIRKALIKGVESVCKEDEIFTDGFTRKQIVTWVEKQGEQKLIMIQWQGNNLKEVIDFTGKDKNFEKWFKSFEEYEQYVQMHNGIFKLFNEDGSHYEIPVGAWIVKTPDGYNVPSKAKYVREPVVKNPEPKFKVGDVIRPKGSIAEYTIESISGGCYHGKGWGLEIGHDNDYELVEQKPADKIEPKFKVGDWIVNKVGKVNKVVAIDDDCGGVTLDDNTYLSGSWKDMYHLWTINDAKSGDVLVSSSGKPFIFKGFFDNDPMAYGGLVADDSFWPASNSNWTTVYCKPATKEQCDLLFKKVKEAGYEWDAEKKELKKIEKDSAWSEEDLICLGYLADFVDKNGDEFYGNNKPKVVKWIRSFANLTTPQQEWSEEDEEMYKEVLTDIIYAKNDLEAKECLGLSKRAMEAFNWFSKRYKSLKPQNTWKPNDKQMQLRFGIRTKQKQSDR